MRIAPSTASRPSGFRPTRRTSERDAQPAWGLAPPSGSGAQPTSCGPTANRRFTASISPGRCSTSLPGAATRGSSAGSNDQPTKRSTLAWICSTRLGAVEGGRLTSLGARLHGIPLHPRLARLLLEARGSWRAALACAVLSERHFLPSRTATTTSDLLSAVEHEQQLPSHVLHTARALQRTSGIEASAAALDERSFRRAVFHAYPDRVGRRRQSGSPRVLLASGHGAVLSEASGVRGGEFVAAIDVRASRRGEGGRRRFTSPATSNASG